MDPQAATTVVKTATDPTQLTALMTISFGLMKLLEMTLTALFKKYKPAKPQHLEFEIDPVFKKKIDDIDEKLNMVSMVMERTDNDGTPMVYSSRTSVDAIREIVIIIRNISQTQERLTHVIERLEQKFVDHDRSDAAVYTQISNTLDRLSRSFDEHDKRVTDIVNLQMDIKRIGEENRRTLDSLKDSSE